MRKISAFLLATIGVFLGAQGLQAGLKTMQKEQQRVAEAKKEVLKFDGELGDAYRTKDIKYLKKHLSPVCTHVNQFGRNQTKKQFLADMSTGRLVFTSYEAVDKEALIFADTAVVTGNLAATMEQGDQEVGGTFAYTRTYVKEDGEWKMVASQYTAHRPLPQPQAEGQRQA